MSLGQVPEVIGGGETLPTDLMNQIGVATTKLDELTAAMKEAKDSDETRYAELKAQVDQTAGTLSELKDKHDEEVREGQLKAAVEMADEWRQYRDNLRSPSKANQIGGGRDLSDSDRQDGEFIEAVAKHFNRRSAEEQTEGKATLERLGLKHEENWGKATLGTTDALGGWVIPNALVDTFIKPARFNNPYRELMTVVNGVQGAAVDVPFRSSLPSRAVIAAFGATKENVDLAYNGYTVTMYTLARIHDLGNQFIRQSRGAAEQDVLQELATAFALGEAFYIREGTGSSQPFGYTSALTNGPATFRTSFTPSSATLAGSILTSIALAAGDLAARGRTPTGAVLSASVYWQMASQGLDGTGFFYAPAAGPAAIRPGTLLTPWGLPVHPDATANNEGTAAVVDNLVVAEWPAFKVFFGQNYRVDSSDQAGTRWDTNVTGFRGEEEMGFDARPAVYTGAAQMITDVTP